MEEESHAWQTSFFLIRRGDKHPIMTTRMFYFEEGADAHISRKGGIFGKVTEAHTSHLAELHSEKGRRNAHIDRYQLLFEQGEKHIGSTRSFGKGADAHIPGLNGNFGSSGKQIW
jgi:hypothetical protein